MNRDLFAGRPWFRSLALTAVVAFGIVTIVGSNGGGGGGGGNGDGGDRAPQIPSSVRYTADFGGLILNLGEVTLETRIGLRGTYRRGTRAYTIDSEGLTGLFAIASPANGAPTLDNDGEIRLQVIEALGFVYGGRPTSGVLRLGNINPVMIRVNNNIGGSGKPGVDLEYLSSSSSHTWVEFEALLEDESAPHYQVSAAAAWFVLRTVYDHLQTLMDQTIYLTGNDDHLQDAGNGTGVLTECNPYAPESTQGDRRFIWIDGPGQQPGELGPGDRFEISFDECFVDRGEDIAGTLYRDGSIRLNNYLESNSPFGIGWFDTRFDDLRVQRIDREQGNPQPGIIITTGSFGLVDEQPSTAIGFQFLLGPDTSTIINAGNVVEVADAGINALSLPRTIGGIVLDIFIAAVLDPGVDDFCTGGAHAVNPLPTGGNAPAVGKAYTITFTGCTIDDGEVQTELDGTLTLTIDSLTGTLDAPGTYNVAITIDPVSLTIASGGEASTLTGATRYARNSAPPLITESMTNVPGKQLFIAEPSFISAFGPYTVAASVNTTTEAFSLGAPGNVAHIDRSDIPGVLVVTVEQAIAGVGDASPASGRVLITAEDDSALRLIIEDGMVTLALDTDGDGEVDDTFGPFPWEDIAD